MPDIDKWAGNSFPISDWSDDVDPGVANARLVADKTTSITIVRGGAAQDAQNVRIEDTRGRSSAQSEGNITGETDVLIIGYKSHPTISDTNIQRGDRFAVGGVSYEVVMIVPGLIDSLQAFAKVRA